MNQNRGFSWVGFLAGLIIILALQSFFGKNGAENVVLQDYNEFLSMLNQNKFAAVQVTPHGNGTVTIAATEKTEKKDKEGKVSIEEKKYTITALADPKLIERLAAKPEVKFITQTQSTWLPTLLSWIVPVALFFLLWSWLLRRAGGGMGGGMNQTFLFGKSKAKLFQENGARVTFQDVAGAEEAKEELKELIQFLKDPRKFTKLGGKMPKGYLLIGRPGTGKTLMARAVAGEAGVPFFSITGSNFVEMFIGVGASRVRDLFAQAQAQAPCIIFIDELDAIGKSRDASLLTSNDEREQTLNQLLAEMDGFENASAGIIIIAATNRPEVLDPALLRPGRFDRHIIVQLPDIKGRRAILEVHARNVPLAEDADLDSLARGTALFSGADLANLINEAALLAARNGEEKVTKKDFELAKDRVTIGAERKSMVMSEKDKKTAAYHEAGHTLIAKMLPDADPVEKVTIIPRGMALGFTESRPKEEQYTLTKTYLEAKLAVLMGGRTAEEIIFGEVSTGAQNDIEEATETAHSMVTQ